MQITPEEIAETLAMVSKQHLDIRTITLGLNLRGCTDSRHRRHGAQGLRPHDHGRRAAGAHRPSSSSASTASPS